MVYASGADSRVLALQLTTQGAEKAQKWIVQNTFRGQSHDIRSLILTNGDSELLSAGVTTDLCIYPLI